MISARENIRNNLSVLLAQNKMTQKKLAERLELSQTAVTNWIKGKNAPDIDTLIEICEIFQVSINEMISEPSALFISKEIEALNEKYLALDAHGKALVDLILEKELERTKKEQTANIRPIISAVDDQKEENTSVISIPFYDMPVSAGTGIYLQDTYLDEIPVEASDLTRRTDFALRVNGDSMEPRYHNDDILLIERQQTVAPGECGVFILNGEGYFKKLGENQLISLNEKYRPISFGEYDIIECVGKVIGKLKQS